MDKNDVKYAKTTTSVGTDRGVPVTIIYGSHWPADDPVVKRYPELFSDDPTYGLYATVDPRSAAVEEASAVPGEKRRVAVNSSRRALDA